MPLDPKQVEDCRAWLIKAWKDLGGGDNALAGSPPFTEDALFHAQQAAEKALKAFLAWHDVPFRKTHDLREIGIQCAAIDDSLKDLCERAEELTPHAWQFRYPGEPGEPTLDDGRQALALARDVFEAVLARLPGEVRP